MGKIICVGLLIFFCALAAQSFVCKVCYRVRRYWPCKEPSYCTVESGQFCQTTQIQYKGRYQMEIKNCTSRGLADCNPRRQNALSDLKISRSCCTRSMCNI